jgi:ELWxxDGT repeat protein
LQLPADVLSVDEWVVSGDRFYMVANTPAGKQLWTAKNQEAWSLTDAARDGEPKSLTSGENGSIFFTAENSSTGREVWFSDGTPSGTGLAFDIDRGSGSANPKQMRYDPVTKTLLVIGTNEKWGDQVWSIQGSGVATRAVGVAPQLSRVSYAGMLDGTFRMQVTYSRLMSIDSAPSINFSSQIASDSLTFDHGRWLDGQTYEAVFRLQGTAKLDSVSVEVLGGTDSTGQPVVPMAFSNLFRLDLRDLPDGWHNAAMPMDVDRDGHVVPLDVLRLIVDLNAKGSRKLELDRPVTEDALYLDVNNDGYISPLDALLIINGINARGAGESHERPMAAADTSPAFDFLVWQQMASDEEHEELSASSEL